MTYSEINRIATHNGAFQADEVLALATLMILYPNATIIRTRDNELIKSCDIAVDVGQGPFDHHQIGGNGFHDLGVPKASFGLVWEKFGSEVCLHILKNQYPSDIDVTELKQSIIKEFVEAIDAEDNGTASISSKSSETDIKVTTFSSLTRLFNPTWLEEDASFDEAFLEFLEIAQKTLVRFVRHEFAKLQLKSNILKAETLCSGKIVVFDFKTDLHLWQSLTREFHPDALIAVYQDLGDKNWRLQCIRHNSQDFSCKHLLPNPWRGLTQFNIVDGFIFCHSQGWIAGTNQKESAIKLAKMSLSMD